MRVRVCNIVQLSGLLLFYDDLLSFMTFSLLFFKYPLSCKEKDIIISVLIEYLSL